MFNAIAHRYDFLNQLLSLGIHKGWRKKSIQLLQSQHPKTILDIATGTADFAIEAMRLNPEKVTGVDISSGMLELGRKKVEKLGLQSKIELKLADSENLPFADNTFDAITVGFGVRNFENLEKGIRDMHRVLKPGGCFLFCSPSDHFTDWMIGGKIFGDAYRNWFNKIARHHHTDSPAVWTDRLNRHGFEVEKIWYYFSPKATQTLELGHYFGLPNLITRKLFGQWVVWPSRSNPFLRFLDATLRPIYDEPLPKIGSMVFCVARKPK